MLHDCQLSLQLGTVRENRKRPIDCCNCCDCTASSPIFAEWILNEGSIDLDASEFGTKLLTVTLVSGFLEVCLCMCHGLVKWHWEVQYRLWAKVSSWLAPNFVHSGCVLFVTASHDKVCTACPQGNGDGLGEWAASVSTWQTWASSWCGTSAWRADASPNMSLCHTMASSMPLSCPLKLA